MSADAKPTRHQLAMLQHLADLHAKFPHNTHGFNPTYRERAARAWRNPLEGLGYVKIDRLSDSHFRYSITAAGLEALILSTPSPRIEEGQSDV